MPLPHATGVYGQLPGRDFNPLDLLLLLRTVRLHLHERMSLKLGLKILAQHRNYVESDPISLTPEYFRIAEVKSSEAEAAYLGRSE